MNVRMMILAIVAVALGSVSACGDNAGSGVAMPPSSSTQALDTAQVLRQARQTSEVTDPYPINDGALVLTDTSDNGEALGINAT
jgi:hypothetical protein